MKFASAISPLLVAAASAMSPPLRGASVAAHLADKKAEHASAFLAFATGAGAGDVAAAEAAQAAQAFSAQPKSDSTMMYIGIGAVVLVVVALVLVVVQLTRGAPGKVKAGPSPDTSVLLVPRFKVPPRKLDEFKRSFTDFYASIQPEQENLLYYGFTVDEENSMVMCREAYKNAAGLLTHLTNVDASLKAALKIGTLASIEVHGPLDQLEQLREALTPLGCRFFVAESSCKLHGVKLPASYGPGVADRSVLLVPHFTAPPAERLEEFKALFAECEAAIKPEEEGLLWYGFSVDEASGAAHCREAYNSAEGLLLHLDNVAEAVGKMNAIADLASMEVHGPAGELDQLREPLAKFSAKFFASDAGSVSWLVNTFASLDDVSVFALLHDSGNKMKEQLEGKIDKGSRTREMVEARAQGFTDKAKDFVIREMNDTSRALLNALDSDESLAMLEFNQSVEASFPPVTVLLAGMLSPTVLAASYVGHIIQLLALFVPIFIFTSWAIYEDFGAVCDIPTMQAWIWVAFVLSGLQVVGRGALVANISSGQAELKAKTTEIQKRLEANAADGETGISDMQDIFIGTTVLVQEALLIEDKMRKSPMVDVAGVATLLWIFAVIWNFVIVIGWTFVPGTIAFHEKAAAVAAGDYCGAWASVFTARVVCLLTPLFFFLNIASVIQWVIQKVVFSSGVRGGVMRSAKDLDSQSGGIPVVQTLVKSFLFRAETDVKKAKLTVALGEALRLSKERDERKMEMSLLQSRINAGKLERKTMKTFALKHGDDLQSNVQKLEQAGTEDTGAWKVKGAELAAAAEARAAMSQKVATEQLDKIVEYVTKLAEQVQNNEQVKAAIEKAKKAAEDAKEAAAEAQKQAEEGLAQAQQAATEGLAQAQQAATEGLAQAQEGLAKAQEAAPGMLAQAQAQAEAGMAEASKAAAKAQKEAKKAADKYSK